MEKHEPLIDFKNHQLYSVFGLDSYCTDEFRYQSLTKHCCNIILLNVGAMNNVSIRALRSLIDKSLRNGINDDLHYLADTDTIGVCGNIMRVLNMFSENNVPYFENFLPYKIIEINETTKYASFVKMSFEELFIMISKNRTILNYES